MTEEEFTDIIERLLTVGVPPTAVAKAFDIDPFVVKQKMADLRVARYGMAELSEAMAELQWEAFEQAKQMIYDAPHGPRSRFIMGILGKTLSLTARQNPETLGNMREDFMELLTGMADTDDDLAGTDTAAFVAVDEADEDQDEGSLSRAAGPQQ